MKGRGQIRWNDILAVLLGQTDNISSQNLA